MRIITTAFLLLFAAPSYSRTLSDDEAKYLCMATYEGLFTVANVNAPSEVLEYSFFEVGAVDFFDEAIKNRLYDQMLHHIFFYLGQNKLNKSSYTPDQMAKMFCLPADINPWKLSYKPTS